MNNGFCSYKKTPFLCPTGGRSSARKESSIRTRNPRSKEQTFLLFYFSSPDLYQRSKIRPVSTPCTSCSCAYGPRTSHVAANMCVPYLWYHTYGIVPYVLHRSYENDRVHSVCLATTLATTNDCDAHRDGKLVAAMPVAPP